MPHADRYATNLGAKLHKVHVNLAGLEEAALDSVVFGGEVESKDSIPATPEEPDEVEIFSEELESYGIASSLRFSYA